MECAHVDRVTIEFYSLASIYTVRRILHDLNINSYVPASKPFITEKQRQIHLEWCLERKDWSVRKWKNIIWSDESKFLLFGNAMFGVPETRFNIENLRPTDKHGGGSIMFWDCFSRKGLGPLIKVDGKMNQHDYIEIL